jgi:LPXTG-motif cell wall-anchored protein
MRYSAPDTKVLSKNSKESCMKQRVHTLLQLAVVFALVLSLTPLRAIAQESMSEKADIVATAIAAGDFTALMELVEAAGLTETLQGEGPFTVFAPTDEAFAALPADVLEALIADPETLQSVLLYHILPGRVVAALISDGKEIATAEGSNVIFSFADGVKKVNGATIVARDIQTSNGVIHAIDSVILPPELAAALGVSEAPAAEEATPEATEEAAAAETTPEATAEATPEATEAAAAETTPEATEAAAAEATPEATEAAAAETTPEATEAAAAEATPEATEAAAAETTPEATEAAAAEATSEATETAAAEITPEATEAAAAEATSEATEAAAAETTPEATEAAAAEATSEATEEAATEEAPAPDSLPVTGAESNNLGMLAAILVLIVVAGVAVTARRRLA